MTNLGSKHFQNMEGPFLPIKNRSLNKSWFYRKLVDGRGEEVSRSWLVYSPSKWLLFCFGCVLYPVLSNQATSQLGQETGFYQWEHHERISSRENSPAHRKSFAQWKETGRGLAENRGIVDAMHLLRIDKEKQKWRDILTRTLHYIKYLATQNLALRGRREFLQDIYDDSNAGNFLGLIIVGCFRSCYERTSCFRQKSS